VQFGGNKIHTIQAISYRKNFRASVEQAVFPGGCCSCYYDFPFSTSLFSRNDSRLGQVLQSSPSEQPSGTAGEVFLQVRCLSCHPPPHCTGARHGPLQSFSALELMHLTCGEYTRSWGHQRHVTNVEVRATTGCCPLSHLVTDTRLQLFGHIARSSPQEDHHRAIAAVIRKPPPKWKRPLGRLSHTRAPWV